MSLAGAAPPAGYLFDLLSPHLRVNERRRARTTLFRTHRLPVLRLRRTPSPPNSPSRALRDIERDLEVAPSGGIRGSDCFTTASFASIGGYLGGDLAGAPRARGAALR
jgi:hypothetical protein